MKDVLVLFSGGKDSFFATLMALEKGYKVHLVTFDNSCGLKSTNALIGAKRIQKKYGEDRVSILGIKKTDAIWRSLIVCFYNYSGEFIFKEFGQVTISQFNCLSCRLAMYILSIIICRQNKIFCVIDGARKSQIFAIEQEEMLQKFRDLFQEYNLSIDFPLADETDDYEIKNRILAKGFVPKMNEPQCLLGVPIVGGAMNVEILNGVLNVYTKELYPKLNKILSQYENTLFEGDYL